MNTLCFWSGGKDSTASIILAHIHHLPITEIVFCEVMFDKSRNISGEIPEHIDFIRNIAIPIFEEWGYKIKILHADCDYMDLFFIPLQGQRQKKTTVNTAVGLSAADVQGMTD